MRRVEGSPANPEQDTYGIRDTLMGGPGLDGYAYRADVYCIRDGQDIARDVLTGGRRMNWTDFCDSEQIPQPVFFGESEYPEHCAKCGERLPTSVIGAT